MILAGDIGGTHTRLALFALSDDADQLVLLRDATYPSHDYPSLEKIISLFLQPAEKPALACIGVAGPVLQGHVAPVNLGWAVDARLLSHSLGISGLWVINDLEAHAWGIHDLQSADLISIKPGAEVSGNSALIAAGTGLGEAGLFWDGERRHAFAGEGGHCDFAPRNETEIELHRYLLKKFGRVSWERVLSGPGLLNIYEFLRNFCTEIEPRWLQDELAHAQDPSAVISRCGLEARAPICARTLDIFIAVYGAEAGNLALKFMATGGVFISGGIAAKILPRLKGPEFTQAFITKGRMQPLLESIPVRVITNDKVGLIGAARYAADHAYAKKIVAADAR
jgi:glucokinase